MAAQIISCAWVEQEVRVVNLPDDLANKPIDKAILEAEERDRLWRLYLQEADECGCSADEAREYASLMMSQA
jgi:hypothetical protein